VKLYCQKSLVIGNFPSSLQPGRGGIYSKSRFHGIRQSSKLSWRRRCNWRVHTSKGRGERHGTPYTILAEIERVGGKEIADGLRALLTADRGPSFPKPIDIFIDALTGKIISHTKEGKIREDHLDLPSDVSNGLPPNLLLNFLPAIPETKLSFVAPTAKPRLISVSIKPAGEVPFSVGGTSRKAVDYVLHVELGGLAGVIAPIIGKQPGRLPHLDPRRRCSRIHSRRGSAL
jgi:hypothetical protein